MLTSRQITDLLSEPFSSLTKGKVGFMAQRERADRPGSSARSRAFLDHVQAIDVPPAETYEHPGQGALPRRDDGPLSPVEQMWLGGLPTDPAAVPFEDAKVLAAMDSSTPASKFPIDHKVVQRAWQPVKEHHDRLAARAAIRNASAPLPPVPSSALPALAEAIGAQNSQLQPDEALSRAGQAISAATAKARAKRDAQLQAARAQLDAVELARSNRTATAGMPAAERTALTSDWGY